MITTSAFKSKGSFFIWILSIYMQDINKEKVAVYIDGSNFYHYLKDKEINYSKGSGFDFNAFVNFLVGSQRVCVSKRYYTGIFRNIDGSLKSQELIRGQQKFLSKLDRDGFIIKRGKIIYDNARQRENSTDVKIAVDLVIGAVDDIYDVAILISSDTDLIPAVKYVKYRSKKMEYVGFSHAPSFAMIRNSNLTTLLKSEDVNNFIKNKKQYAGQEN